MDAGNKRLQRLLDAQPSYRNLEVQLNYLNLSAGRRTIYSKPVLRHSFKPPEFTKTDEQKTFLAGVLRKNFLFYDMTEEERGVFILALQPEQFEAGETIIKEGDVGDFFYVVAEGTVNFTKANKPVGSCGQGGSFGELALLYDAPRAATCVAQTSVSVYKVDQQIFRSLLAKNSKNRHDDVEGLIRGINIFSNLDEMMLHRLARAMTAVPFRENDLIVQKGHAGTVFYIVQTGRVKIHDIGLGDSKMDDQILKPGDWFGERALLTGQPRAANATALDNDTVLLAIDKGTFETTIGPLKGLLEFEMRKKFLQALPLFSKSNLTEAELNQLVTLMEEVNYKKGDKLAHAGQPYELKLWIIRTGRLIVSQAKKAADGPAKVYDLKTGDMFGDKSIYRDSSHMSSHDAVCDEDLAAWVLTREAIEGVVGDIRHRSLEKHEPFGLPSTVGEPSSVKNRVVSILLSPPAAGPAAGCGMTQLSRATSQMVYGEMYAEKPKVKFANLKKHRLLGQGAFGKVWLVEDVKDFGTAYALKTLRKVDVLESRQEETVMREKELLATLEHPFILKSYATFQDVDHLYLLLPVIAGGELYSVLHKQRQSPDKGLPNDSAAFYSACIMEALGHLHQRSIAYRDLKLENVLIDERGYCVLVDLGFAKVVENRTYTLVGTPEYLAPEIIMSKGHDKAVDYWSFGVVVFELLVGVSPFYEKGTSQIDIFRRIMRGNYAVPEYCRAEAADLIKKLLVRREMKRLGNLSRGYLEIMSHAWYEVSGIDFMSVLKYEAKAPWVPVVDDPLDGTNFDHVKKEEENAEPPRKLTEKEQALFKDY